MKNYDVVVVGAGIVGLVSALAIAQESQLRIALLEASPLRISWQKEKYGERVSAISKASINIFKNLKCFNNICEKRISPYQKMHVWDAVNGSEIIFDAAHIHENVLGFIIEDNVMRAALIEKIKESGEVELLTGQLHAINQKEEYVELIDQNDQVLKAKLLIAADGAHSAVREMLNISWQDCDYDETALVFTVKTELPHEKTARQIFLKEGPLAFLPLDHPHYCSIVWSAAHDYAKELLALSDEAFAAKLNSAFQNKLGKVTCESQPRHFPLRMRHVKNYVQNRIALVGDAAHTIHPMVGQGVNLGLLDAVTLAEVVVNADKKNRDFGSYHTLRRYERFRKSETTFMLAMINSLRQKQLRCIGFQVTNYMPFLKNFFSRYALGVREDLPKLTRVS